MTRNVPARRPQVRQTPDERRKAALEATLQLLGSLPYDEILVEDIAIAAGMSRPLLYHYFGGKDHLAAEALRWCGEAMVEAVLGAGEIGGPEGIRDGIRAYLDFVTEKTNWYTALVRHTYLPGTRTESVRKSIRVRIAEGILGLLAPSGGSTLLRLLVSGWVSQVETICREWLIDPALEKAAVESLLVDLLVANLHTGASRDHETAAALHRYSAE